MSRAALCSALIAGLMSVPRVSQAVMYPSTSGKLHFYPAKDADAAAKFLAATADEDRAWAAHEVGRDYDGITDVRVALDPVSFSAMQPPTAPAPPWATGVAYPALNLVVIRVSAKEPDPRAILRHELSHIAVGRLTGTRGPRWLLEGLAVVHSGDAWNEEGPSLVQAALSGSLLPLDKLVREFPAAPSDAELAYAESAAFVKYLIDRFGEDKIQSVLREMVKGGAFDKAVITVMGESPAELETAWRRSLGKWDLFLRFITGHQLLWGLVALLAVFAGMMAMRRRRTRMVAAEREEEELAVQALVSVPAVWADRLNDDSEAQDLPNAPARGDSDGDAEGDEDLPEHVVESGEPGPKKPTLH